VSEACRTLGYSRDTFYRVKKQYEEAGLDGLRELSRKKPNVKNRVPEDIEQAVLEIAVEYPAFGQVRAASKLAELKGFNLSPTGVRGIWQRHDLETKKKRLKALEAKVAKDGYVLTEAQIQALESAAQEKEAFGEILRRHDEGRGSHLPADVHRYV
jgi:transposase